MFTILLYFIENMLCECFLCDFFVIGSAIFGAIYLYFKYAQSHWKRLNIPYIEPRFPYGNGYQTVTGTLHAGIQLTEYYNYFKYLGHKYGGTYFFTRPSLIVTDLDLVKSILIKDFSHFTDRGFYHDEENDPLSAHLFALDGPKWKSLRTKLSPAFTSGKLKRMLEILIDCSSELKSCLDEPIKINEPIDIKNILVKYTTDVIGSCGFGIECNSFKNPKTEFITTSSKIFEFEGWERIKFLFAITFPKIAKLLKTRLTNPEVDKFYRNLIEETVAYREKNSIVRNDFMHLLIQLKNKGYIEDDHNDDGELNGEKTTTKLTMDELSAQAFLFFAAGFESSSTSMTWTLFELSQNIEVQDLLRKEILSVTKEYEGNITYEALMKMNYLDCVVNESLRKYPPFMFLQRIVSRNYTLPDRSVTLDKGTQFLVPIYAIHLDPEYYPDPEKFDPNRFTEENKRKRPDYTWLPFGDGPRNCIGLRFALLQMKVALCQLLLHYKFTLHPKTKLPVVIDPGQVAASAKGSIWLNAENIVS